MKRIMRFIGNRERPEKALYGVVEELHRTALPSFTAADWTKALSTDLLRTMSAPSPLFNRIYTPWIQDVEVEDKPKPEMIEEPFETNLTEPLIGWRTWNFEDGSLRSLVNEAVWVPDTPFHAICPQAACVHSPTQKHSCGIYARNSQEELGDYREDGKISGLVLGWGRYVRATDGWRSEFAYPVKFLLEQDQIEYLDDLKKYHVPIYILKPMRLYDPQEDGYEYWRNQEDWHFRASSEPYAEEDYDPNED
jgi:hypothetical protein